ncbi:UDP-glycosyltransferase 91C1-like [Iris pallida]|uniref:UDP-glycosyltransferase 91C1-like n=1 Tax=Iris pallida TaxID=29817 RepID=A0AAX6FWF5_IRIPA|nr:UDP-glycosyltransferase 91C1-like [Iris pallida]
MLDFSRRSGSARRCRETTRTERSTVSEFRRPRLVMVEEGGGYRARSREMKSVIGSKEVQDSYVTKFVEHLKSIGLHEKIMFINLNDCVYELKRDIVSGLCCVIYLFFGYIYFYLVL